MLIVARTLGCGDHIDETYSDGAAGHGHMVGVRGDLCRASEGAPDIGRSLVGPGIDHIVPRSLGNTDHPDKHQLLPRP